ITPTVEGSFSGASAVAGPYLRSLRQEGIKPMKISAMKLSFCMALATACSAQGAPQSSPGEPLATVAGQPIYEQDLQAVVGPKLLQLDNQKNQVKSSALQDAIRQNHSEAEAKPRGTA